MLILGWHKYSVRYCGVFIFTFSLEKHQKSEVFKTEGYNTQLLHNYVKVEKVSRKLWWAIHKWMTVGSSYFCNLWTRGWVIWELRGKSCGCKLMPGGDGVLPDDEDVTMRSSYSLPFSSFHPPIRGTQLYSKWSEKPQKPHSWDLLIRA
jgi:hypothetical protein